MAEARSQTNVALQAAKNLSEGLLPSNAQIEETLDIAKDALKEQRDTKGIDAKSESIAQDAINVINDTQRLIEEKNRDEKLQRFLLEAKLAAEEIAGQELNLDKAKQKLASAGDDLRPLQDKALEILQMAKSVLFEIMRSSEFRRALLNATELFEQVFWDEVEQKIKPIADNLEQDVKQGDTNLTGTRQAAREASEQAKKQVEQGQASSEQAEKKKEELKRGLNQLLHDISENPEYNQALSDLLSLTDALRSHLEKAAAKTKGAAKEAVKEATKEVDNVHVKRMWQEGQKIIEEFCGHDRIQNILDELSALFEFIREDERANKFFSDLRKYANQALEHPDRLIDTSAKTVDKDVKDAYDQLYEEGREIFKSEELKKHVNNVLAELRKMVRTARHDPASKRLAESTRNLIQDLTFDPATGKPSLWTLRDNIEKSGRSILLPVLLRELEIVPVRGIRGSTESYDYAVRNLSFSAYDLLPERARFYMDLDVDLDLSALKRQDAEEWHRSQESDINSTIVLRLDRIKAHVKDVQFHYLRKTFPSIEDWGRMDIDTTGNGCSLEVIWRIVSPLGGAAPKVVGHKIRVHIDGLDVNIKEAAKHEIIDTLMAKMFAGQLKDNVERELERSISSFAQRTASVFNDVFAGRTPAILPLVAALPSLTL